MTARSSSTAQPIKACSSKKSRPGRCRRRKRKTRWATHRWRSFAAGSTAGRCRKTSTRRPPRPAPPVTDEDRKFWAFRPPVTPPVPQVQARHLVRTPIDSFVLARLEAKGLTFSAEASRTTLLRRVSLDLVGLPPAPAEIEAFLADASPDAYERQIDRLLESPHYGERWGRHWLDVAGYTDRRISRPTRRGTCWSSTIGAIATM